MRLVLIRHGESQHGLGGIIAERIGCTGLTDRGVRQVEALAHRLAATSELGDCNVLLSSPVVRARQTAEILAPAFSMQAGEEDADLCEVHPGEADGLSWEAYRARYGELDLPASPTRPFAPGGE